MKRKYYMRGLGIGILATALCFTFLPTGKKSKMTDQEVIARAKELGYTHTEGKSSADAIDKLKNVTLTPEPTKSDENQTTTVTKPPAAPSEPAAPTEPTSVAKKPTEKPVATEVPTKVPAEPTSSILKPTDKPKPTAKPTATKVPTNAPTKVPTKAPTKEPEGSGKSCQIKIERGMSGKKVAALLKEAGAIEDTESFIKYLAEKKLADYINIGTFTIPEGADYQTIGNILTK